MNIWIAGALAGSVASACALEDEIERRGVQAINAYASALWDECGCTGNEEGPAIWADEWRLIRATPEQRAHAFLKATQQAGA